MLCYLLVQIWGEDCDLCEILYCVSVQCVFEFGDDVLDNSGNIDCIFVLCVELVVLFGFDLYGYYLVVIKMVQDLVEVFGFLCDLVLCVKLFVVRDCVELEQFVCEQFGIDSLQVWDLFFVVDCLKQVCYSYFEQEVKQYFIELKVLGGLFLVIEQLYGLCVQEDSVLVWYEDVCFFCLVDVQGVLVGQFYLDLYVCEGKCGGVWMDDCCNCCVCVDGSVQMLLVYLVCNFGWGVNGKLVIFSYNEVIMLFYEMGYGLYQLLICIGELGVVGINGVEWDVVELFSQFMENFCWEWDYLQVMIVYVDSGELLLCVLYECMLVVCNFYSGMVIVCQLEFGLFDMLLYSQFELVQDSVLVLFDCVCMEVVVNYLLVWNCFLYQFSYIFVGGYVVGYYSYKWVEVFSVDVYVVFEEVLQVLVEIGVCFCDEILLCGGSCLVVDNFKVFRGCVLQIDVLLCYLGMV